ncbi:hypothetical protein LCM23_06470 [Cytobacillus kochii]|uniref:hypothetical protein n=1 Tax=Cytobacillus kochii TaxID=859143 RepID=UPI001CD3F066|nr:hypothetical protein [Cytobacillus kochii]MCA1025730.1 hypothetical protein [Cytobacillus kochii]
MFRTIKLKLKQKRCNHTFFDTGEETRCPIKGGQRYFRCPKCHKEIGVYIPEIKNVYNRTEYLNKFNLEGSRYYSQKDWESMTDEEIREIMSRGEEYENCN